MGIPELEEKKKNTESTFEAVMAENILRGGRNGHPGPWETKNIR